MKSRNSTRRKPKPPARAGKPQEAPARPEEPATFGRRRPREIELDRPPARPASGREGSGGGSVLRALVARLFR